MRKHRHLTALALVLALLCALAVPVGAAGAPKLTYTQSGNTAKLTLQELGSESVYGVQLELTFSGSYPSATFTPASSAAYAPPCTCATAEKSTRVTVYLTAQTSLNQNGALELGALALPSTFTMPGSAILTLLGHDLQPLAEGQAVTVSRQSTASNNSGSGSSGGSTRPTPTPAPEPTPTPTPEPTPAPPVPFTDVGENDWYFDAVKYVYDAGMMNGTGGEAFSPNASTTRSMIVTILYRLADSPPASSPTFPDVPSGQFYTYPVGWAAGQSIVNGYEDGLFRPNGLLTREQLAAILYRYSRAMGYNVSARGDLSRFSDREQISPYAQDAMAWAVAAGLLSGMGDGTVNPTGNATRAQVATILTRFSKNVVNPPRGF